MNEVVDLPVLPSTNCTYLETTMQRSETHEKHKTQGIGNGSKNVVDTYVLWKIKI